MDHCCELVEHIQTNCPNLQLVGLMTVGAPGHQYEKGSNPDFEVGTCLKYIAVHMPIIIEMANIFLQN